jgi:hypothetical protein
MPRWGGEVIDGPPSLVLFFTAQILATNFSGVQSPRSAFRRRRRQAKFQFSWLQRKSMSQRIFISLFLFMLAITGCAQVSTTVTPVESYDSSSAYLYGFYTVHARGAGAVALEIQSVADPAKVYTIKFRKDGRLVVSKVDPGKYIISRFLGLSLGNEIAAVQDLYEKPYRVPFELAAGQVYYTGDHEGFGNINISNITVNNGVKMDVSRTWGVLPLKNNFAKATQTLETQYPQFRGVPKRPAFPD